MAFARCWLAYRVFGEDELLVLLRIFGHRELDILPGDALEEVECVPQDEVFGYMRLACPN